jgi:uncharacterized protein YabN with tetrapyrrole methylase and pyrophosphatase domain
MVNYNKSEKFGFSDLVEIMDVLRGPNGCPWDKEQTHTSVRRNFIEEVYEACEAIDNGDAALLSEELGDVMLQVVFHARMSSEAGEFDISDVTDGICRKYCPPSHIFGELKLKTAAPRGAHKLGGYKKQGQAGHIQACADQGGGEKPARADAGGKNPAPRKARRILYDTLRARHVRA